MFVAPGQWVLKGGIALDFRLGERARTTKDLDLESSFEEQLVIEFIRRASELDLEDYFTFDVHPVNVVSESEFDKTVRFRITSELGGRVFDRAGLDVGVSRGQSEPSEIVEGDGFLRFADIEPIRVPVLALEQHLEEKLHAYARVYSGGRPSSRKKELVDIVLKLPCRLVW